MKNVDRNINYIGNYSINRVESIDVLKGIGILFMVLGHMHFSKIFNHYIFAFHMPLFFLISGYLYKTPESLMKAAGRKAKSLFIPYFSFGIGYWILWLVLHGMETETPLVLLWALLFNGIDGLVYESALWFLPTLCVVYILFSMIDRKIVSVVYKTALIILLVLVGCITTNMIYVSKIEGGGIAVLRCRRWGSFSLEPLSGSIRIS